MGGVTIRNGGDVSVGENDKKLVTLAVDELFSRNQNLRWILIDEIGMVPDSLLGAFEKNLAEAAEQNNRYFKRKDKSRRPFGGYNLLMFGDLFQIPPIPASSALFIPPMVEPTMKGKKALDLFWSNDPNIAINFFQQLREQKRIKIDDPWYIHVLDECRRGALEDSSYNFLLGLPTEHAGAYPFFEAYGCTSADCRTLHLKWRKAKKMEARQFARTGVKETRLTLDLSRAQDTTAACLKKGHKQHKYLA